MLAKTDSLAMLGIATEIEASSIDLNRRTEELAG
jgi:hypothetical protein